MPGFNLPPGVSVSDIPGNRPEDEIAEKIYEQQEISISKLAAKWAEDDRLWTTQETVRQNLELFGRAVIDSSQ